MSLKMFLKPFRVMTRCCIILKYAGKQHIPRLGEQGLKPRKVMTMKILETLTTSSGTKIKISFEMKDSLKKAIPSAKWIADEKVWSVGPKSKEKLMDWVEKAKKQFNIDEIQSETDDRKNKINNSCMLNGHTFGFKDELKAKFQSAFFGEKNDKKGWLVSEDEFDSAQTWLDAMNKTRKENHVTEDKIKELRETESAILKLDILKEIINKIGNNYDYAYKDDYFYNHFLKYSNIEKEGKLINGIALALSEYITFADDNDNPGLFFPDTYSDWLRIFGIPQAMIIEFNDDIGYGISSYKIVDYATIESNIINNKINAQEFKSLAIDQISKELDNASHSPVFKIKSKKTGVRIDITHRVDIERLQNSSRVHYYNARNIPVLLDENYVTEVYYWRNKSRKSEYSIEDING